MNEWKMEREDVLKLINLYKINKCLWDYRSSEYKRTDLKREAWQNMSDVFKKDVAEIKKKMKHLRSSYVSEKKKVDEFFGVLPAYRPSLFYYDDMSFLDPIIVLRKTLCFEKYENTDPISDANEEFGEGTMSEHNSEEFESTPLTTSTSSDHKQKRKYLELAPYYSQLNEVVNTLAKVSKMSTEESVYTAFGKTLALQLSQLSAVEATVTMSEIHQVLSRNTIRSMMSKSRKTSLSSIANGTSKNRKLSVFVQEKTDKDNQQFEAHEEFL